MSAYDYQQASGEHTDAPSAPTIPPPPQLPATHPDAPGNVPAQVATAHTTGYERERPRLDACPYCNVGLLYPISWDEQALHEAGQPLYHPRVRSGGAVQLMCFNCGKQHSSALNPEPAPPDPRVGW